MALWWRACSKCRRFTRRNQPVCSRCGHTEATPAAVTAPVNMPRGRTVVLYGAPPMESELPVVAWLVLDDGGGKRVTHRLAMTCRIADAADADVRIPGMVGACTISGGADGFTLTADDGATPRLNGAPADRAALVDNDVLEIHGKRVVFKATR